MKDIELSLEPIVWRVAERRTPPVSAAPALPRARADVSIRIRTLVGVAVGIGAAAVVWLSMARITGAVSLFLSPDGGHYLTDADALLGRGVRDLAHPPAFPAFVAATHGLVSSIGQVQLALAASLWILIVSLYVLCRQYTGIAASIAGAGIGATFPAVGELLAWNGGATLLATAFLVLALAMTERWLRTGRARDALAVGLAAAAALLAHPFVAAVAFFCVLVRWAVERVARGRPYALTARGNPFSVAHLALVALPVAVAIPIVLPYYRAVEADAGVRFGVPRLGAMWDTLTWGFREQGSLLLLFLAFVLAAVFGGRASATLAGSIGAVYLVVSSASRADPSYRTRVAYLLPIIGAVGAALLWQRLAPPVVRLLCPPEDRRRIVAGFLAVVVVGVFASLGYLPRLPRAAAFYQRLDPVDVTALHTLDPGRGSLVASSWNQNAYGNGISNAWYVEGLAHRKAAGPTDPALSTLRREKLVGAAMQQFFAGESGVENGALQLAIGPEQSINTPGVQAMIGGMYRPVLYINDAVNGYPKPLGRAATAFRDLAAGATVTHAVTASGITGAYASASDAAPQLRMDAQLRGRGTDFDYRWSGAAPGGLAIRLFPGYGILWRDARQDDRELTFVADPFSLTGVSTAGDRGVTVTVRAVGGTAIHYLDRDPQFGLQSIELMPGPSTGRVQFRVSVATSTPLHRPRTFDQTTLIHRYRITDVVLWKDTGWKPRFSAGECFLPTQETRRLLIYRVRDRCEGS